jgi:peptide/nickel transport system substrate-binding protein
MELRYWREEFVGAGPYKVREWVPGSHLLLEANDRYLLGRPRVDQIEIRLIPDANTLLANVLAGQIELTLGRSLSLEQGLQVRAQWTEGHLETTVSNWITIFPQYLDPDPPIVADVRFRRALLHAIDRQEIVDSLLGGAVPIAHSMIDPGQPEYAAVQARIVSYDYDPRTAAQMVEELGYARGADGLLADGTGQRLSVEIRQAGGDSTRQKVLLSVGDYWRRIGVGMEPHFVSPQRQQDRQYRATFPSFELVQNPNYLRGLTNLHSSQAPLPTNNFSGSNRSRYRDAEFDALYDRFVSTIPRDERLQVLGQITYHLTDRLVLMGLYYGTEITIIGNHLQHVQAAKVRGTTQAWNAHEWDLKA